MLALAGRGNSGPLPHSPILLAKGKFLLTLFQLKSLLSLGTFIAVYWALYGIKFGIGFAALILVHEMGHFIDIRRAAALPVPICRYFSQGLAPTCAGPRSACPVRTPRDFVSLAGPLAGSLGAAACALLWMRKTGQAFWIGLASLSALLNVLNLISRLGARRWAGGRGAR